jgi:hypothetical protein
MKKGGIYLTDRWNSWFCVPNPKVYKSYQLGGQRGSRPSNWCQACDQRSMTLTSL